MSITRKCGMCDEPVLKANSQAPLRCASCQRRYMEIGSSLDPNRVRNRRIQWLLERRGDKSAEIAAFLSRKVETPKAPKEGSRAAEIEAFLKAHGGPRGFTPMTEVDKIVEMAAIMYRRKARAAAIHEQWREALLAYGEGL